MDSTSKQSWPSASVDLGIILAIIVLAFHKADGQVWFVLSQIALVRFGVAVHKTASGTIAQMSSGGGGNGSGGGPNSGNGGGGSGQMRSVQVPPETPARNESTFPRAPRMSPALIPSTLIAVAVILSAAISLAAR